MGPVGAILFCIGLWVTLGAILFETGRQVTATVAAVLILVGVTCLWEGSFPEDYFDD